MLSDIEYLEAILLGGNNLERGESKFSDSIRRPDSPNYKTLEDNEDSYPNSRENRSSNSANYGHNSAGTDSSADLIDYQVNLT